MKFDICVDTVEGIIAAERAGADSVELCDNFIEGGTTPSVGAIKIGRKLCPIDIHVMIRPRGGNFTYNEIEFETMLADVQIDRCQWNNFWCATRKWGNRLQEM